MSIRKKLVEEKGIVGVWGLGYVGLTTACAFAREGVRVHGYDIDLDIVQSINSGKCHIPNLERWLGYSIKELTDFEILHAVASPALMKDCDVHFVAVPTEKDGKPWMQPLDDVLNQIGRGSLVIIESTLVPGTTQTYINKGLRLAVSPRRDFFNKPEYNLRNLPRIYSGQDRDVSKIVREVLSIVCDTLIEADDLTQAELVKSVENSILHVCATYAQQLALAYPNVDIRKVLKLASTHWRIPLYYPSMGTGGYACDECTEILTTSGWKTYKQISIGEDCISYNIGKNVLEYDMINDIFIRKYTGPMVYIKTHSMDQLLHPQHRCIVYNQTGDDLHIVQASQLPNIIRMPVAAPLDDKDCLRVSLPYARVIGWVLAEGYLNTTTPYPYFDLSQGKYVIQMEKDLSDANIRYKKRLHTRAGTIKNGIRTNIDVYAFRLCRNDTREMLKYIDHNKRLTRESMKLSVDCKREVLKTLLLGDGSRNGNIWCRNSIKEIQEFATLAGIRCNDNSYALHLSNRSRTYLKKSTDVSSVDYSGTIWCVSTNNQTFIGRRNGKVFITGNCIPLSSQYVKQGAKRPGELTLCDETIRYDGSQPARIASIIANRIGDRLRIAILGLCYKGDLKVIKGSPALPIIDELKRLGKNVFVHDPYFGKTEILRITNATPIFFPAHLRDMDAIIVVSDHQMYKGICHPCLNSCLKSGQIILDNYGVWENRQSEFDRLGIIYHTMGDKGWTLK